MHLTLLVSIGVWLMAEGLMAAFYIYPPPFWAIVRVARIVLGGALLLEARRVRVRYHIDEKERKEDWKLKQGYIDLLTLVGVWTSVDGIGTGFIGYVYPILPWQLVRLIRVIAGASLVVGSRYFTKKLGPI